MSDDEIKLTAKELSDLEDDIKFKVGVNENMKYLKLTVDEIKENQKNMKDDFYKNVSVKHKESKNYTNFIVGLALGVPSTIFILFRIAEVVGK